MLYRFGRRAGGQFIAAWQPIQGGMHVTRFRLLAGTVPIFMAALFGMSPASAGAGLGVGNVPQGTQLDSTYAGSFAANNVTNVDATTGQTSCYTPEVPYATNLGPAEGYSGESACLNKHGKSLANTGEN